MKNTNCTKHKCNSIKDCKSYLEEETEEGCKIERERKKIDAQFVQKTFCGTDFLHRHTKKKHLFWHDLRNLKVVKKKKTGRTDCLEDRMMTFLSVFDPNYCKN